MSLSFFAWTCCNLSSCSNISRCSWFLLFSFAYYSLRREIDECRSIYCDGFTTVVYSKTLYVIILDYQSRIDWIHSRAMYICLCIFLLWNIVSHTECKDLKRAKPKTIAGSSGKVDKHFHQRLAVFNLLDFSCDFTTLWDSLIIHHRTEASGHCHSILE